MVMLLMWSLVDALRCWQSNCLKLALTQHPMLPAQCAAVQQHAHS
jgi:hypothetical protein